MEAQRTSRLVKELMEVCAEDWRSDQDPASRREIDDQAYLILNRFAEDPGIRAAYAHFYEELKHEGLS